MATSGRFSDGSVHWSAHAEANNADVVVGPVAVRLPPDAPQRLDGGRLIRQVRTQPDGPLEQCREVKQRAAQSTSRTVLISWAI
jgi:hypothetical protein